MENENVENRNKKFWTSRCRGHAPVQTADSSVELFGKQSLYNSEDFR